MSPRHQPRKEAAKAPPREIVRALIQAGFRRFSGTPCSLIQPLFDAARNEPEVDFHPAVNEGDAVAMAAGFALAGEPAAVLFQNSGLGNAVNPLTSLAIPFRLPMLLIVSHRGDPAHDPDEPQHRLMGQITPELLRLMGIPANPFPTTAADASSRLAEIRERWNHEPGPSAWILPPGVLDSSDKGSPAPGSEYSPPEAQSESSGSSADPDRGLTLFRKDVLEFLIRSRSPRDIFIATTGYTGRELCFLQDHPAHFYMTGSMGCASPLGLGLSLSHPGRRIIVIDGDGALLMRLQNLAMVGMYQPSNFLHLVLDNRCHESTGGQPSGSESVDFPAIARACGYRVARTIGSLKGMEDLIAEFRLSGGPILGHIPIRVGVPEKLPRPELSPQDNARRLSVYLRTDTDDAPATDHTV